MNFKNWFFEAEEPEKQKTLKLGPATRIVDMEKEEISGYFPEFFKLKDQCKFNNCLHKDEPHCAIKKALENDQISWSRYKSYLKILEGDEEHYRTDIYDEDRKASDETRNK